MIYGVHLIAGAVIGKAVNPVWLAGIIALVSHFVLDICPHWDYALETTKKYKPSQKEFWRDGKNMIIYTGAAIIIIAAILHSQSTSAYEAWKIWLMAFIAGLPDLLVGWGHVSKNKYVLKYVAFHHRIHNFRHTRSKLGLALELTLTIILIGWLTI